MSPWIQAARPLAQANIAIPLLFGQAAAYAVHGAFSLGWLAFAAAFGVVDQLFLVFANDYADRHADGPSRTPFSGGSGVLTEQRIAPASLLRAALGMASLLMLLSALGALLGGRPLLIAAAVVALALLHAYSFPPLRLSYRGHGEWLQALGVGAVLPFTGYYAQSGDAAPPAWVIVPALVLGLAGNLLTSIPDVDADAQADKRTFAVRFGERRAAGAVILLVAGALALAVGLGPGLGQSSLAAVLLATGLPLVAAAATGLRGDERRRARLRFVVLGGAAQHGLLLAWAGALVAKCI